VRNPTNQKPDFKESKQNYNLGTNVFPFPSHNTHSHKVDRH